MARDDSALHLDCRCGTVSIALEAPPFLCAVCYCDDCQEAGRRMAAPKDAPSVLDPDGGSPVVLVRKDRVAVIKGADALAEFRLAPDSPTRRVIATCCDTPMFLDVAMAHWVTIFRDRLPKAGRPPVAMRVMTKFRTSDLPYPDAAPRHGGHTGRFFLKVLGAWIGMGLKRPKLPPYPPASL